MQLCVDETFWQKVCLLPYHQGMRQSQFDELCGLQQIAVSWAVYFRAFRSEFTTYKSSQSEI
jgi:hypothetical protein